MICEGCGITVEPFAAFPGDLCVDCYAPNPWGREDGAASLGAVLAIAGAAGAVYLAGHVIAAAVRLLGGVL